MIWRPDFEWLDRVRASVPGRARRFWQGSHDHRGVPGSPGRVVTLVRETGVHCDGMAWRVAADRVRATLDRLDRREQDGYARESVSLRLADGREATAITWVAVPGNPSWLGPAPLDELVETIRSRSGPSGSNTDYVLSLADGLEQLGVVDAHVTTLAERLRQRA